MNQQPDKLFRDKLQGYNQAVPSRAWDKIETNLGKKNNVALWLKVAASLLVLAVAAFVLWPADENINPDHKLADKTSDTSTQKTATEKNHSEATEAIQQADEATEKIREQKSTPAPQPTLQVKQIEESIDESAINVADHKAIAEHPLDDTVELSPEIRVESETIVAQEMISEPAEQNITLVFHADDTDEYLDKKSLAKATAEQEDASTFKKLLKKVKGLKNNQDPFGELRQKKNEILALNFKNEKRGQNK
ncbi:MAG TPA: hypothetical protein VGK59_05185 [Ohtaekwangia sp.]